MQPVRIISLTGEMWFPSLSDFFSLALLQNDCSQVRRNQSRQCSLKLYGWIIEEWLNNIHNPDVNLQKNKIRIFAQFFMQRLSDICLLDVLTGCQKILAHFWCDIDNKSLSQSFNLPPSWQDQMIFSFLVYQNERLTIMRCRYFLNRNCIWWLKSCGERARFQSTSRRVDSVASSASVSTATYYYTHLELYRHRPDYCRVCQSCATMATHQQWILQ